MKSSSSRYRTIHCMIWNDDKFPHLSPEGKLVFFLLLTTTFSSPFGAYKAGKAALEEESRMDEKGFAKGFAEVLAKGMANYNEEARFIFLPNFLKHNQPANPNVVKMWGKIFNELPECNLKEFTFNAISECCKGLGKGFAEGFAKGFVEPNRNGMRIQEQEQEQEQEQNTTTAREGNGIFKMHVDWEPSGHFEVLAKTAGVQPPGHERLSAILQDFVPYWMSKTRQGTQHDWDLALVKSIKAGFYDKQRGAQKNGSATNFDSIDYQAGSTRDEDIPDFLRGSSH